MPVVRKESILSLALRMKTCESDNEAAEEQARTPGEKRKC